MEILETLETQPRKSFFPKQFEPYNDKIDPNSVIKYRPKSTLVLAENFNQDTTRDCSGSTSTTSILVSLFIVFTLITALTSVN